MFLHDTQRHRTFSFAQWPFVVLQLIILPEAREHCYKRFDRRLQTENVINSNTFYGAFLTVKVLYR